MNNVSLIGRLVRDPEVRYSQGEKATCVAKFTLAVDRKFKKEGEDSADFIGCTAFGKSGEFVEKYFHKGMKAAVVGEWRTGSYTNKDGNKVYTNDCFVTSVEFCESKGSNNAGNNTAPDDNSFMNIPANIDEEVPFN